MTENPFGKDRMHSWIRVGSRRRRRAGCGRIGRSFAPAALAAGLVVLAVPAAAQSPASRAPSPLDTTGVAPDPRLHMLLEKTIFKIDILTLEVRFGPETAARLDSLARGRQYSRALEDSVMAAALDARDAWARMEFQRNFGFDRFTEGLTGSVRAAVRAGIVTPAMYDTISSSLPEWYSFLPERGVLDGDEMFYRVLGDTLRTVYRGADGRILLEQTDVGPQRGRALLGGWLAPGSDFREGLVKSLFAGSG
jgi:hypothetical protein